MDKYAVSPEQLVWLHTCLSSKLCIRIFDVLSSEGKPLNISTICRKAGCTSGNAVKHLRRLIKLGVVEERLLSGLHIFAFKRGEMAELMLKAEEILRAENVKRGKLKGCMQRVKPPQQHGSLKAQPYKPKSQLREAS
ncbi:helix-turn-helix transcriptional regulator [Candidatus Bathyarchaeota archaeon]|nr:helix-turn-helix transcriptional regulator [Candidatus Bathyarchaeota archaeon]